MSESSTLHKRIVAVGVTALAVFTLVFFFPGAVEEAAKKL
jgi:hypothetical protein